MIKKIISLNMLALVATYSSLFYQTNIDVERLAVDRIEKDQVIAGGAPFQFLIDGEISPVGSIGIDPLSLVIGLDEFHYLYFILDYIFWLLILLSLYFIYLKYSYLKRT